MRKVERKVIKILARRECHRFRKEIYEVEGLPVLFPKCLMLFQDASAVRCMDEATKICVPAFWERLALQKLQCHFPFSLRSSVKKGSASVLPHSLRAMTGGVNVENSTRKLKTTNNVQSFEQFRNSHCGCQRMKRVSRPLNMIGIFGHQSQQNYGQIFRRVN